RDGRSPKLFYPAVGF
ncbi:unnamed protein product, partial [Rotaria sp. Silwood1]